MYRYIIVCGESVWSESGFTNMLDAVKAVESKLVEINLDDDCIIEVHVHMYDY